MTNDEAKFLLNGYRPGGADARNPALGGALAQAKEDPALGAWLARSQAFDAAIAARVREVTPPPGLRESILAGAQISVAEARSRWRPSWLAIAAAVAVLFVVGGTLWLAPGRQSVRVPAGFADFALNDLHTPGHIGDPDSTTRHWLSTSTAALDSGAMPIDLARMQDQGCRSLRFQGRQVFEVCFARGGKEFHLYVLPRPGEGEVPVAQSTGRQDDAVAVWADARYVYAVATRAGAGVLKQLL